MKDNQILDESKTADTAEAEVKQAATDTGKFKDVKALMEAYQALEAEFTRRSQRLKELEANEANKEKEAPAPADIPPAETAEAANPLSSSQNAVISDEVKNAVIEEYLNGIFSKRGVPFVTGGGAVAAQRRTHTTLKESGALAGKLFHNNEEQ